MFIAKNNDLIILANESKSALEEQLQFMVYTSIEETDVEYQLYNGQYLTPEEIEVIERERKDKMTLTPADVERALYKAKQMDFDDLKEYIAQQLTGVDLKALNIEFKASTFYRGAKFGNGRLFDVVGSLLGYSSDDMDYLFENKELPEQEAVDEQETEEEQAEEE